MAKEKPIFKGGYGVKAEVYPNRVVIKHNIFKSTTIPISQIVNVEVHGLSKRVHIQTDKKTYKVSAGRKAGELRDAIIANMK